MADINTYVDKIFFINMDKDTDRYNDLMKQFEKHGITNYEKISGIVVDDIRGYCMFGPYNNCDKEKYIRGSAGCLQAHRRAIQLAKERGYKRILILEDDIELADNFNEKFNDFAKRIDGDISYWNIIYLGLCSWQRVITNTKFNDYLTRIKGGGTCAFGYIVNSNIYDFILANIDYVKCEIDLLYNNFNIRELTQTYKLNDEIIKHIHGNESNISVVISNNT